VQKFGNQNPPTGEYGNAGIHSRIPEREVLMDQRPPGPAYSQAGVQPPGNLPSATENERVGEPNPCVHSNVSHQRRLVVRACGHHGRLGLVVERAAGLNADGQLRTAAFSVLSWQSDARSDATHPQLSTRPDAYGQGQLVATEWRGAGADDMYDGRAGFWAAAGEQRERRG
jgi:hypothetical protein